MRVKVSRVLGDTLLWLFIFTQLFGPKFGFVDSAVLSSGVAAIAVAPFATGRLRVSSKYIAFIVALAGFYTYTLFLAAINGGEDSYTILRYLRFLASAILLPIVFGSLRNFPPERIIRMIGLCIIVHAAFIIIQMLFPEIKEKMGPWVGYEKEMFRYRAFGLVGAYDSAAAYLCIGMLIYASLFYSGVRGYRIGAAIFFLWFAGLFTGRVFMLIGTAILIAIFLYYLSKGPLSWQKFILVSMFVMGMTYVWMAVGEFVVASFTVDREAYENLALFEGEGGYHLGSIHEIFGMVSGFFPPDVLNLIFGGLSNPGWTDIGYSKLIYTHGLVGAFWMLGIYALLAVTAVSKSSRLREMTSIATLCTFTILAIFNYKMFVFGSRGYTELFLIMVLVSSMAYGKTAGSRAARALVVTPTLAPR